MGFARLPIFLGIILATEYLEDFPILVGIDSQHNVCVIVVVHGLTLSERFEDLNPFPSHELAKVNGIDPVVVILKVIPTLAAGHRIGEGTVDFPTRTLETETTVDSFDLVLFKLHGLILADGFRILKPFLGLSDFRL